MQEVRNRLTQFKEEIEKGENVETTPRELLSIFTAYRRGAKVVYSIRQALNSLGLTTEPDFEQAFVDARIKLVLAGKATERSPNDQKEKFSSATLNLQTLPEVVRGGSIPDPVPRIRSLKAANQVPVSLTRDQEVLEASTLMLLNDFSQLPIIQNGRTVHGMISWRSIGSCRTLNGECKYIRDCIEPIEIVDSDCPLLEAIDLISRKEVVLVREPTGLICGIVTNSDLSLEFRSRSEPFLLVGEIENHIRRLIDGKFSKQKLKAARDSRDTGREIETVADLTFGEYIRLLEVPDNWKTLGVNLSRTPFIDRLNHVKEIRNDVMHFNPDPLDESDLRLLRDTVKLLQVIKVGQEANSVQNPTNQSA